MHDFVGDKQHTIDDGSSVQIWQVLFDCKIYHNYQNVTTHPRFICTFTTLHWTDLIPLDPTIPDCSPFQFTTLVCSSQGQNHWHFQYPFEFIQWVHPRTYTQPIALKPLKFEVKFAMIHTGGGTLDLIACETFGGEAHRTTIEIWHKVV